MRRTAESINKAIEAAAAAGHELYMEHFGTYYRIYRARERRGRVQLFTAFNAWETIEKIESRIFTDEQIHAVKI